MKRRENRPYIRRRSRMGVDGEARPARLASLAGRAMVERLEARQLLFSLTISADDVDPSGLGTARAIFGYAIPAITTSEQVGTDDPVVVLEDFTEVAVGNVGGNVEFDDSFMRMRHNVFPPSDVRIRADIDGDGDPIEGTEELLVRLANINEFISYEFDAGEDLAADNVDRPMTQFSIDFERDVGQFGLPYNEIRADVLMRGDVVASFTGNALRDLNQAPNGIDGLVTGRGTFQFDAANPAIGGPFDRVVFTAIGGPSAAFVVDNVQGTFTPGNFVDIVSARLFGAEITFRGPVGASVQVLDLYGRDMVNTISVGQPDDVEFVLIDADDNGVPDFNDGIGQIIFSNVDVRSSFTMFGGTIEAGANPNASPNIFALPNDIYQEGAGDFAFVYERGDSLLGIYDEFESGGFGYGIVTDDQGNPTITGLPPGPGAVIIGSPIVRDNTNGATYNAQGLDPATGDAVRDPTTFSRSDQGIVVQGGATMGRINIPGLLHGTSRFTGAIEELIVGHLLGSISVEGDVGMIAIAGDAGNWSVDAGVVNPTGINNNNRTESEIFVGRTIRELLVGGRSLADVTVLGDLSDPKNRPALDTLQRIEREFINAFDENSNINERDVLRAIIENNFVPGVLLSGQDFIFGESLFRNDTVLSAEWLGSIGTGVILQGTVGFGDPAVNTVDDPADVFAFAVGDEPVLFEAAPETLDQPIHIRVIDEDGRTLAGLDRSVLREVSAIDVVPRVLRFDAPAPGVYYLVVGSPNQADGDTDVGADYRIAVTGMAPTTAGMYRVAGGYGSNDIATSSSFNVIAGDVGTFRVGTGFVIGDGTEVTPQSVFNSREDDLDEAMDFRSGSISVPGNLYDLTFGSDLGNATILRQSGEFVLINIGGDLGRLHTGLSSIVGINPDEGDINYTIMNVGGNIGVLDIRGAVGIDQDTDGEDSLELAGLDLTTGTAGDAGDIGMIRIGNHVRGGAMFVNTPDGSTVGGFLVSQDAGTAFGPAGEFGIIGDLGNLGTRLFQTGQGSEIRFVDFPEIDLEQSVNAGLDLFDGQAVEITDDTGGTVRITISGTTPGAQVGFVRFLPIDGSEGVAIAQIEANLAGGRQLDITSIGQPNSTDTVSIGTINIQAATANSSINISGSVPVDVWRIVQTGGAAFNEIVNNAPNSDILAIDVIGINRVEISDGSLGRTEPLAFGPLLFGPELGVQSGLSGDVGAPLGLSANTIHPLWNGNLYRPTTDADDTTAYLDDIGGVYDTFLDGLVVRTGNVAEVTVGKSVGDVILQGAGSVLTQLTVNSDQLTDPGEFDGIKGVIYAPIINSVEVGDGIAPAAQGPIANVGIFAEDEIRNVEGGAVPGATISGFIMAANNTLGQPLEFGGINTISLTGGGDFVDVHIAVELFDGFWDSIDFQDNRVFRGDINSIDASDANFFRSEVFGSDLNTFELSNGFFDASRLQMSDNAQRISATGYRNSTIGGSVLEFSRNEIIIGQDLFTLETERPDGAMVDLRVDVLGSVRESISAGSFSRVDIDVDNRIELLEATDGIRGSAITAGRADAITALGSIVASDIAISGPLLELSAGVAIVNTDIRVSGRDGRLDLLVADQLISGTLTSSGPILTVQTLSGDIVLDIKTTTSNGSLSALNAARDLIVSTDISAGVDAIVAGRHIGDRDNPSVILVRGDLNSVSLPSGQLYSDIRVGGTIGISDQGQGDIGDAVAGVTIGQARHRAGNNNIGGGSIVAFGRIGSVVINGDFAGNIRSGSSGIESVTINNGSLLPEASIIALDGNLESLIINAGHLLGTVHADFDIVDIQVIASLDGTFGDVGVNPALSADTRVDSFRNELPLGVSISSAADGASITAGHNILSFVVTGGSIFESAIYAGREIVLLNVAGGVFNDSATTGFGTTIVAGDAIQTATFGGDVQDALFAAGLFFLGDDNAPGGLGINADAVHQGSVQTLTIGGNARRVGVTAGMNAGNDGLYLTRNETTALGQSVIENFSVAGNSSNVSLSADRFGAGVNRNAFTTFGAAFNVADNQIVNSGFPGTNIPATGLNFTFKGRSGTLTFVGAGQARWDAANGRVILRNTDLTSSLVVTANGGELKDFDVVSKDNASIGVLDIQARLIGNSSVVIDGDAGTVSLRRLDTTGVIRFGGDVASITMNRVDAGHIEAQTVGAISVSSDFGAQNPNTRGEASITVLNATAINIAGDLRARINVQRDLGALNVTRDIDNGLVRVGGSLGAGVLNDATLALNARNMLESRVSVRDFMGVATFSGEMFDSALMIGADLGADGDFGGTGLNADIVSTGFASDVSVGGDFFQSDLIEGALRGPDGFFGTGDDSVAEGRGTIGLVNIADRGVGSTRFTESYRIFSTGLIEGVTIDGRTGEDAGNFAIVDATNLPDPIRVIDLQVTQSSRIYTAEILFNQAIDQSTLANALSVSEVRGTSGSVQIFLIDGQDFTLTYDDDQNRALLTFDRDITSRDLPRLAGVPGQGIYRFELNAQVLRGQVAGAQLDGDGDGFATAGDNYSSDNIVGDAGDKLVDNTATVFDENFQPVHEVDFYSPISLDIVLDDNFESDGLPDANEVFTINGSIGDHPDHDIEFFRFINDVDVYTITLQAGQILRLGPSSGPAALASVSLLNSNGTQATGGAGFDGNPLGATATLLPASPIDATDLSFEQNYLILQTGTYLVTVGSAFGAIPFPNFVPDVASFGGLVGDYSFTLEVFDDGNSGFGADVDSGDGENVVNAPSAQSFAGPDGQLNTADDFNRISIGGFTFFANAGPDGQLGTNDDRISGDNGQGITSTRTGAGVLTSTIESSIGPANHSGVPGDVFADVDIFHLNNGNNIARGTLMEITIKLADNGGDLGSRIADALTLDDFSDSVEFGFFETSEVTGLRDANVIFSPTDFSPNGGETGILARNGNNQFGFDENGDFFIQFVTPGKLGGSGGASYAIYLQGAFNTDYTIEVTTLGSAEVETRGQNFFIETDGGTIDWLRAGGLIADLNEFDVKVLGLTGTNDQGTPLGEVILDSLVANLEELYANLGLDVRFSTNPADFEFEDFSTIYLSSSPDPVNPIFAELEFFGLDDFFESLGFDQGLLTQPFQIAEHSDPFNTDSRDEGVVFLPTFSRLGYSPSESDVQDLISSLTAATSQTANELLGLRHTASNGIGAGVFDANAADAVQVVPGDNDAFIIPTIDRALSSQLDPVTGTDFWLGDQNASELLEKILSTI